MHREAAIPLRREFERVVAPTLRELDDLVRPRLTAEQVAELKESLRELMMLDDD